MRVQFGTNSAVVTEYIRALVLSGKLTQYSGTSQALTGPDGTTALPAGEDHRSLYQLLKELQEQVGRDSTCPVRMHAALWHRNRWAGTAPLL